MWIGWPVWKMWNKGPLSGDVMQEILRSVGQFGLFNFHFGQTPNPALEERILEDVGSYGRQIGRLADALDVLIGTLDLNSLSDEQRNAVHAFKAQLNEVRRIKAKAGKPDPDLSRPVPKILYQAFKV